MSRDRSQQVSDLYHRALQCTPEARDAFIRETCGSDEALREEVESLLQ
jgi:hypothetical protein